MKREQLEKRVKQIGEQVLYEQQYVSAIDILVGIGYLHQVHLVDWRKGRIPYLEGAIEANLNKISFAMKCFRQWASSKSLKPSETKYMISTKNEKRALRFSKSGDANIEKAYRTHYVSPILSEKKQQKLKEKLEKPPERVVFSILKESQCDHCHQELFKGNFLYQEQDRGLCMKCSGFDALVFLPSGDAKRTRRAKQYSEVYAVVVQFNRTRKRYERQGLLVQAAALKKADAEIEGE